MASVRILHCADLHIGATESFLGVRAQSRRAETLIAFENIMKYAVQSLTDIVLISGDLLDSNSVEKNFFDRIISAVADAKSVKVVFSAGNHDPLSADSPFVNCELPENLYVFPTHYTLFEFPELKTRVYGKSFGSIYESGVSSFPLETSADFINLMCIHGDMRADLGSDYNSVTEEFIKASGMDYIALGHIHKRTEIMKCGSVYCAYCGCAEGQGFDELGSKGVYAGEISKSAALLKFVPMSRRMHLLEKADISGITDAQKISEQILELLQNKYSENYSENLYKIVLTGTVPEDTQILNAEIETRLNEKLYFAKVIDRTEPAINYEELRKEKSLKGIFVNNMLCRIEQSDGEDKELFTKALNLGIKAFRTEVGFDED